MKVFILEDDAERLSRLTQMLDGHEMTVVSSCSDVGSFEPPYDLISLDHDLGGRQMDLVHEDSGYEFVKLISSRINPEAYVILHSFNPEGRKRMRAELDDHLVHVYSIPFGNKQYKDALRIIEDKVAAAASGDSNDDLEWVTKT